jgi:hypothetical protein
MGFFPVFILMGGFLFVWITLASSTLKQQLAKIDALQKAIVEAEQRGASAQEVESLQVQYTRSVRAYNALCVSPAVKIPARLLGHKPLAI